MPHIHELYDFTSSAYILHPTERKLCMHYHKKLKSWLQPGGHIELDEDPLQALHHEVEEETGLKPSEYEILEPIEQPKLRGSKTIPLPMNFNVHRFGKTEHRHLDLGYLLRSKTERLEPKQDESAQIGWFTIDEIRKLHEQGELYDSMLDVSEWIFAHY